MTALRSRTPIGSATPVSGAVGELASEEAAGVIGYPRGLPANGGTP
ncbi:hypothetical protein [Streptosporangium vulgare]|uniref:Uncharacterized protein n=1 Tax=Streptosporangium vulgare TaxID=46190 RepID=A0ABV5TIX3_9ACTN